jgi:putative flippase GtrA
VAGSARGRFVRYAAGSAAATGASAVTFALAYRGLHAGPQVASVTAFAAGALVNFVSARFWAWSRRHRLGLSRDLAGYLALAVTTALAAATVTTIAERHTRTWLLVMAAYFGTYAAMFLVKFVLLDRVIFRSRHHVVKTTRA